MKYRKRAVCRALESGWALAIYFRLRDDFGHACGVNSVWHVNYRFCGVSVETTVNAHDKAETRPMARRRSFTPLDRLTAVITAIISGLYPSV